MLKLLSSTGSWCSGNGAPWQGFWVTNFALNTTFNVTPEVKLQVSQALGYANESLSININWDEQLRIWDIHIYSPHLFSAQDMVPIFDQVDLDDHGLQTRRSKSFVWNIPEFVVKYIQPKRVYEEIDGTWRLSECWNHNTIIQRFPNDPKQDSCLICIHNTYAIGPTQHHEDGSRTDCAMCTDSMICERGELPKSAKNYWMNYEALLESSALNASHKLINHSVWSHYYVNGTKSANLKKGIVRQFLEQTNHLIILFEGSNKADLVPRQFLSTPNAEQRNYQCHRAGICLEGNRCREGHMGFMCSQCNSTGGHRKGPNGSCARCPNKGAVRLVLYVLVSVVMIYL
mmetsp:Transcript_28562/g.44667  ORF Transcript_28562/g.44667 Transcript_28562/m.44667 type:complete len:344 (+) Transcript_28562:25-1056(+)